MKHWILAFLIATALSPAPLSAQSPDCVTLTFDQAGVLPSASGFEYQGSLPETDVFSVAGGRLHLDTIGTGAAAAYVIPGAYDPSRDFVLEFSARVLQVTGAFGLDFEVSDDTLDFEFAIMDNGVFLPLPDRPFLPLGTSAGETHVYRIESAAGSLVYQLFVDGALVVTRAIAPGGDPGMRLFFGDGTLGADSRAEIDDLRFCQPRSVLAVAIDVKPGSLPNSIQRRSRGRIPVAILGSDSFSVLAVSPATVIFAGAAAASRPNGAPQASVEDVNGDGWDDLVLHFHTEDVQLEAGDTVATLSGELLDGTPIAGQDTVRVLP